jgi:microfibrillar-associated protein 1
MSNVQRKQAPRPARPAARYWKGKAPKGIAEAHSDSDSDREGVAEDETAVEGQVDDEGIEEFGMKQEQEPMKPRGMNIALKDVSVSKEGKVIVAGREESGRTLMEVEEGAL